mgnify:CR=1 FL=1
MKKVINNCNLQQSSGTNRFPVKVRKYRGLFLLFYFNLKFCDIFNPLFVCQILMILIINKPLCLVSVVFAKRNTRYAGRDNTKRFVPIGS